jgi:hypothetical protein
MTFNGTVGTLTSSGSKCYLTTGTTKSFLIGKSAATTAWDGTMYFNENVWFEGVNLYAKSDENLKTIKDNVNIPIEKLIEIRKVYYNYLNNDVTDMGVIAQDIYKICPEIVYVNDDGYLAVAYNKLSVLALLAIDELNKRIKELENIIGE